MTRTRFLVTALTPVLALALAGCGDDAPDTGTTPEAAGDQDQQEQAVGADGEVVIQGFTFDPRSLEIPVGTTVAWRNTDGINHTATSGEPGELDGAFDVELPEAGSSGEHTFEEPGTFTYFCTFHESMTGEVVVSG